MLQSHLCEIRVALRRNWLLREKVARRCIIIYEQEQEYFSVEQHL